MARVVAREQVLPAAAGSDAPPLPRGRLLALALAGVVLTALYAAATARLWLPRYFPGPGISLGFPNIYGDDAWLTASAHYVGLVVLSFAAYSMALAAVWRPGRRIPGPLLYGFPVLAVLVLAWMYPPTAVDMFHYQADARTFWIFHDNPLTVPPMAHPYAIGISWAEQPSPYGPFWNLLTFAPALLAGSHYLAGLILFKVLSGAFLIGCAWLIARLVAGLRPGWETIAVVLFAWNPFIMLRVAGNGHNDLVMMFFVLLAFERAQRGHWTLAFPALALSVLVKYVTALLAPILLVYAWTHTEGGARERIRALLPGMALSVLVVALCYVPVWSGKATFDTVLGEANGKMITSVPLLLQWRLAGPLGEADAASTAKLISRLAFLALYLPLMWQARHDFRRLVACSVNAFFLYLVVATAWFRPWYVLWPLTMAALLPGTWYTPFFLALSFSCSFPDLVEQYRYNWDWLAADTWRVLTAPVAVQFWLPMMVWLAGLAAFRSWFFDTSPPRANAPPIASPTHR